MLAALAFLFVKRQHFDRSVLRLLSLSIVATIASEIAFTFYISAYGLSNQIGHYLKTDEKTLLDTICRNIIEHGEFRFACVALTELHQGKLLRPVASAGDDAGLFKKAELIGAISDGADDPIGTIFWTGRPKVVNNIQEDGEAIAWLPADAKPDCASAIILPLSDDGNIMGALMISSDQPGAFDSQQVELLTELARDAAFGITTLRMQNRRKTIEAERQLLAMAIEQASECIAIADHNALLEYVNPAVERITGLRPQTYIGRPIGDLLTDDHVTDIDTILHQAKTGKPWTGHINGRTLEGTVLNLNVALSPVRDSAQKIDHFVAIIRDITRECQMERQLIQSQKMEAMGTLAGGIAHDFNNILAAINGFTELALDEVGRNTTVERNLQEVLMAGQRAKELVHQILTFSRQTKPERKPVGVKLIVEEAAKLLRSSLPATIEIRQNLNSDGMVTGIIRALCAGSNLFNRQNTLTLNFAL